MAQKRKIKRKRKSSKAPKASLLEKKEKRTWENLTFFHDELGGLIKGWLKEAKRMRILAQLNLGV